MISYRLSHLNISKAVFYQLGYTKERKKSEYAKLRKKKMKAITIKQPWVSLMVNGVINFRIVNSYLFKYLIK